MRRPVVAIDGPAGAGKTTVTQRVAAELGYLLVDTGALYRAVALAALREGYDFADEAKVGALAEALAREDRVGFHAAESGIAKILLDGEDVSPLIRTQEISQGASKVSALPRVRQALLEMQRKEGRAGGVVLEGRDIGTVVFPEAEAKFFLTASVDVRAERRYQELRDRGADADLERVRAEVLERDRRDSARPIAPLRRAEDALSIDSSMLSIDQVVALIVERVRAAERALVQAEREAGSEE